MNFFLRIKNGILPIGLFSLMLVWQAGCQTTASENWLKVPIEICVKANQENVGDVPEVYEYCNCLIPKVYEAVKMDREKVEFMRNGNLDFLRITQDSAIFAIMDVCLPDKTPPMKTQPLAAVLTPQKEKGIRIGLRDEAAANEAFKQTNDIEKYCDCIIDHFKKDLTVAEFYAKEFVTSDKYLNMQSNCRKISRR